MRSAPLALLAILVALVLTGCGESSFVGTWAMDRESFREAMMAEIESEQPDEEAEGLAAIGQALGETLIEELVNAIDLTIEIRDDGTSVATSNVGDEPPVEGTWKVSGGKLILNMEDEDEPATGTIEEGVLVLEMQDEDGGSASIRFNRVE